jgi:hypothetical protein
VAAVVSLRRRVASRGEPPAHMRREVQGQVVKMGIPLAQQTSRQECRCTTLHLNETIRDSYTSSLTVDTVSVRPEPPSTGLRAGFASVRPERSGAKSKDAQDRLRAAKSKAARPRHTRALRLRRCRGEACPKLVEGLRANGGELLAKSVALCQCPVVRLRLTMPRYARAARSSRARSLATPVSRGRLARLISRSSRYLPDPPLDSLFDGSPVSVP